MSAPARLALALAPALLAAAALAPRPAAAQGPDADWRVVETPHFRVHYPASAGEWSRRLAARLESVRDAVTAEVGHAPAARIDVVVADPAAIANGSAWPLLGLPRMVLWTTPPGATSTLAQRSDWGELVAVHEFAHLAHLLRPSRNPWRSLVERTVVPVGPLALKSPRWAIEGYATLVEGRVTGSGRPRSALRAALLRAWGRTGRLPSYAALSDDRRSFLGRSMAYLVGSAFLEWVERRAGDERALERLWAAATARADRSFDEAWQRVFGDRPREAYARFTAETTAAALAGERALGEYAREGEIWLEREGSTGEPAVSPDGRELAAVVDARDRRPRLVVWSLEAPAEAAPGAPEPRPDPQDPESRPAPPRRQPEARALEPAGAVELVGARWLGDGSGLLVVALAPDRAGVRHAELFLWRGGSLSRVTRRGDLFDADPEPGDASAIAVRWRDGGSQLVRVALADGATTELTPVALDAVHDQPRVAPGGGALAWLEHRDGRWRTMVAALPRYDRGHSEPGGGLGAARELELGAGEPSHLAWHPRGTHLYLAVARGERIDLEAVAVAPGARDHQVTRSLDAALAPAPAPDGATLYYLALDPDGLDLRRLPLDAATVQLDAEPANAPIVAVPPPLAARPETVSAERRYGAGRAEVVPLLGGWAGSHAGALELGVAAGDLVGRWQLVALGALGGDDARQGGALRAELRALPVAIAAQVARIDEAGERSSAAELVTGRRLEGTAGVARLAAGLGWSRFEAGGHDPERERTLGFAALDYAGRFGRGALEARPALALERSVELDGESEWTAAAASLELAGPSRSLELWARRRRASGVSAPRDLARLGGAPSSLAPARHEPGRIDHPALEPGELVAARIDGAGARLAVAGPVALLWERWEDDAGGRPLELAGLEAAGRLAAQPLLGLPRIGWRIGVARARGGALAGEATRWWLGLGFPAPGATRAARGVSSAEPGAAGATAR